MDGGCPLCRASKQRKRAGVTERHAFYSELPNRPLHIHFLYHPKLFYPLCRSFACYLLLKNNPQPQLHSERDVNDATKFSLFFFLSLPRQQEERKIRYAVSTWYNRRQSGATLLNNHTQHM